MDTIEIVTLQPEDWRQYRDLRLRALKEEPQAYGSTYEDNAKRPDEFWQKRLEESLIMSTQWLVFAKSDRMLVGMMGAFIEKEQSDSAHIIAVYVIPEARGKGIAKSLMKELLESIKTNKQIKNIIVDVNVEQTVAFNLYKNSGFEISKQYRAKLGDGKEHDIYQLQTVIN